MKIIAITGGIGSGKSYAAEYIKSKGYGVISCDEITKELYERENVIKDILAVFPLANKGERIDYSVISKEIFSNAESKAKLEHYLHPLIMKEVFERAKNQGETVFVEVPLLFESNLQDKFDDVLVIVRNKADRIRAVRERSGLSVDEINARINSQFDYSVLNGKYKTIVNTGDKSFETAVDEYLKTL